jgi:hypothetical protein
MIAHNDLMINADPAFTTGSNTAIKCSPPYLGVLMTTEPISKDRTYRRKKKSDGYIYVRRWVKKENAQKLKDFIDEIEGRKK